MRVPPGSVPRGLSWGQETYRSAHTASEYQTLQDEDPRLASGGFELL